MSLNLSVSSSAPCYLSSFADSPAVKWTSRALVVVALALAILGVLTVKTSSIQSATFLSIAFPVGLGSVSLLARQTIREEIGIDRVKALKEMQESYSHLKSTVYKKIYYHIDEKVFSKEKGITNHQRRMTLYPLSDGKFHIKTHQEIGSGTRKTVYLGDSPGSSTVRTEEKNPPQNDEIIIYRKLKEATHVVHCYQVIQDDATKRSLILEYCEKGTFKHVYGKMDSSTQLAVIRDALLGLSELHGIGYLHLDCHLENIFITPNDEGRLADFGSCRPTNHLNDEGLFVNFMPVGDKLPLPIVFQFLAPEIVFNIDAYKKNLPLREITGKADIWMLGMALARKLCPKLPAYVQVIGTQEAVKKELMKTYPNLKPQHSFCPFILLPEHVNQYLTGLTDHYPRAPENAQSFEYLLWWMLHPDPDKRCSELQAIEKIDEILKFLS